MRIPWILVVSAVASALLAGCASEVRDDSGASRQAVTTPSNTRSAPSGTSTTAGAVPARPPADGAAMQDVVRWVEAGEPVDPSGFRTVTRDGATASLSDGVAFVTAGTSPPEVNCVTNRYRDGALACLVDLADPPPRPDGTEGMWKGNWVDFTGTTLEVGSAHGDPGPFGEGSGAELAEGRSVAFGDYRCRADADGLLCVNYAHLTGARLSVAGVQPFGCLEKVSPPPGVGEQYGC